MKRKTNKAYGSWPSPFQIEQMLQSSVGLSGLHYEGGELCFIESRPNEKGRYVVVRRLADGTTSDLIPQGFNARTRVHEYGGASYTIIDNQVVFSNFSDQRLYSVYPGHEPVALTTEVGSTLRVADGVHDRTHHRLICVAEKHNDEHDVANYLAAVKLDGAGIEVLEHGCDFYASPRLSPDGSWLAWIEWDHPNMPWDDTRLMVARVGENGQLSAKRRIAGGVDESVMDPQWSRDGKTLYFVSDRSNWWNIYAVEPTAADSSEATCLHSMDAEFGGPMWQLGDSSYVILSDGRLACTYNVRGLWHLGVISPNAPVNGRLESIELPYTALGSIVAQENTVAMVAGSASSPPAIIEIDLRTKAVSVVKRSSDLEVDQRYVSKPRVIAVPTTGGATTFALFYAPKNPKFKGLKGELPPLMVMSHGGPTSSAGSSFSFLIQYYTSRGFAVADVNYRGSTGFGRKYRNELRGNWGVVDWQDCESVAKSLACKRRVDRKRLAIRGGSAGGYTTLAALAWGTLFKAGASHYGVGDLTALAGDTHKFESRYLDRLIGPYPAAKDLYESRSPINSADKFDCPVIFFQGMEDKIVPPNQAEAMVAALKAKGLPVCYIAFEGEQHGFRQAPNIKRAIQSEFLFYAKIFGFTPADSIEPLEIHNFRG